MPLRRTPLTRRTPLSARKGITGHKMLADRPRLMETPPFDLEAARRAMQRQQASAEAPERDRTPVPPPTPPAVRPPSGFSPVVRQTILDRDNMRCQRCGVAIDGDSWPGYSLQHRIARGMGGTDDPALNRPANGLTLCGSGVTGCHGHVEGNPTEAERNGWAVARWADPATVPVLTFDGWRVLTDNGTSWPAPAPPDGDAHALATRRAGYR